MAIEQVVALCRQLSAAMATANTWVLCHVTWQDQRQACQRYSCRLHCFKHAPPPSLPPPLPRLLCFAETFGFASSHRPAYIYPFPTVLRSW